MKDVFITKVSSKGGEDGAVTQDVEMVFKGWRSATSSRRTRASSREPSTFGWNIAEMIDDTPAIKLTIK